MRSEKKIRDELKARSRFISELDNPDHGEMLVYQRGFLSALKWVLEGKE